MEVEIWPQESGAQAWSALLSQRMWRARNDVPRYCASTSAGMGIHIWPVACCVSRELLMLVRPAFTAFEVGGFQCPFPGDPKRCDAAAKELQRFLRCVNCQGSTRVWHTIWYLWFPLGLPHNHSYILFESVYILGSLWYFKYGRKFVNYVGEPSTIYKICKHWSKRYI